MRLPEVPLNVSRKSLISGIFRTLVLFDKSWKLWLNGNNIHGRSKWLFWLADDVNAGNIVKRILS
jgi:hypothetical protein